MKRISALLGLLAILFSSKTIAYYPQEGNVTGTLGPFWSKTNFDGSASGANAPVHTGVGLIALGDVNSSGAIEVSMFYMNKLFARQQGGKYLTEQTQILQIATGFRHWLTPRFSVSVAFFSSYSMGDPAVIHTDFPVGTTIDTSARDMTEYGFDFSLESELYSYDKFALILDTRYSLSVTPKPDERADHYGVLLGVKYVVQQKYLEPK